MQRSSSLRYSAAAPIICALIWIACGLPLAAADTANPSAEGVMPDPDAVIRKILGLDDMAKNVCLIGSHQMVNTADLPGRLVGISADRKVPSDLLRYSFRKPGTKPVTQVNPPTTPVQITRLESSQVKSGSFLNWFGASLGKEDIAEVRTTPLPASSISVDDLDEQAITDRFSTVPGDIRKGLGIITDVIPYEVCASICKKTTGKAESGIWYIHLGRDTYSKVSDELRKYYLVAVYTPLVFYDDIGVIPTLKLSPNTSKPWQPDVPVRNRDETLSLWLKDRFGIAELGAFSAEREVGWIDTPQPVLPKPEGATNGGTSDTTTQETQPQKSGASPGFTTVVP